MTSTTDERNGGDKNFKMGTRQEKKLAVIPRASNERKFYPH